MNLYSSIKNLVVTLLLLVLSACGGDNSGFPRADCGASTNLCVSSIAITPKISAVLIGNSQTYQTIATLTDGSEVDISKDVTWDLDNHESASLSIDGGNITVVGLASDVVNISATYRNMSTTAQLSVGAIAVSISPSTASILVGMQQKYQAFAILSNGIHLDITDKVTWQSDDMAIANIDVTAGVVTAMGVTQGSAKISASYQGQSIYAQLSVINTTPEQLIISPVAAVIPAGTSKQYNAYLTTDNGEVIDVTAKVAWSIADKNIATIDENSLVNALVNGNTNISATIVHSGNTLTANANIDVSSGQLTNLAIRPINGQFSVGRIGVYRADAYYSDGIVIDVSREVTWALADESIGIIVESGIFAGDSIAIAPGKSTITATFQSLSTTTAVEVTDAVLTSINISPQNAKAPLGTRVNYQAHGLYSNGTSRNITTLVAWSSSDPSIAAIQFITGSSGIANTFKLGSTDISATFQGLTQSTSLTVINAAVTELQISPQNPSVANGTDGQFNATAYYSDGTTLDVTHDANWAVDDYAIAGIIPSGTQAGYAKAFSIGSNQVSAVFAGITASTTITVTDAVLTSLSLTPSNVEVPAGTTQQYQLFGLFSDGSNTDLTTFANFQSSEPSSVSIDKNGLAKAHYDTGSEITITATYNGSQTTAILTVTDALLDFITITPVNQSIAIGHKGRLSAVAHYTGGLSKDINRLTTWSLDDNDIASVGNGDDNHAGVVLGISPGTVTVTATFEGKKATNTTTVNTAILEKVTINPIKSTIAVGLTQQYNLIALFSDKSSKIVTNDSSWQSSKTTLATIDDNGLANSLVNGDVTITGTYQGLSAEATLTITGTTITALQITPKEPTYPVNTKGNFIAIAYYFNGTSADVSTQVTWYSADPTIVSIITTGSDGGLAHALAVGNTDITASLTGVTSNIATATVTQIKVEEINVSPAQKSVINGVNVHYNAVAIYSDGSSQDITSFVSWQADASIATMTQQGLALTHGVGVTDITAMSDGITGKASLTVQDSDVITLTSIQVTPALITVPTGTQNSFTALAFYNDGTSEDINSQATWLSDDSSVLSIITSGSSAGLATALTPGIAHVNASFDTITSNNAEVTVTDKTISNVQITPNNLSVANGTVVEYRVSVLYTDATHKDVTDSVTLQSADTNLMTFEDGNMAHTHNIGTVKITTIYQGVISENEYLHITAATIERIEISPTSAVVPTNATDNFTAIAYYSDNSNADVSTQVTWTSDNEAVLHIIASGSDAGLATALSAGTANIKAKLNGITSDTAQVIVTDKVIQDIQITPNNREIKVGETLAYTVSVIYTDLSFKDVTSESTLRSLDTNIMTFENGNIAHGLRVGTVEINATYLGMPSEREFLHISQ